jgi:16S rRNA (guanine527-N7)-methyltransferase
MTKLAPEIVEKIERRLYWGLDGLDMEFDKETVHKFIHYLQLLAKWNQTYNLTAVRDPEAMVCYHILDSLAILPSLDQIAGDKKLVVAHILDVGSGAGIPGIILAIARPEWQVTMIDAVAKKATFITQAIIELKLKHAHAIQQRVETFSPKPAADIVVSRAFSKLASFVENTRRAIAEDGCWAAMKGERPDPEIADLPKDVRVAGVDTLAVPGIDGAERCLVVMEKA